MGLLKVIGVSTLALGLLLGTVLPGLSASNSIASSPEVTFPGGNDNSHGDQKAWDKVCVIKGTIASVDREKGLITLEELPTVIIKVDDATRYIKATGPGSARLGLGGAKGWAGKLDRDEFPPGLGKKLGIRVPPRHQPATIEDLYPGLRVVVHAVKQEEGILAKQVVINVSPGHIAGTVTEVGENTITITPEEGDAVTLTYSSDTFFYLRGTTAVAPGQKAFAIYEGNVDEGAVAKVVRVGFPHPDEASAPSD